MPYSKAVADALKYTLFSGWSILNLKSDLNIPKHRNDYENILIEMNDYVNGLMLSELLNIHFIKDLHIHYY